MNNLDTLLDAWLSGQEANYLHQLEQEEAHKEWEERSKKECISDLQHHFLTDPERKHYQFSTYTMRQLVDEAMDPDVHIPQMLELIRRAANGEDISGDAGDLVLELSTKCVSDNLETFLRD